MTTRTVRTRPRNGLAISDVLAAVLLSELCAPSQEFWLATAWVTDVLVIDNTTRQFDSLMGNEPRATMTLSEVLGSMSRRGAQLHLAVRDIAHNQAFVDRLKRVSDADALHVYSSGDLHEKVMVGWSWVLKGSMNFTWNGTHFNEESMDLQVDLAEAARQRLELRTRWIHGAG